MNKTNQRKRRIIAALVMGSFVLLPVALLYLPKGLAQLSGQSPGANFLFAFGQMAGFWESYAILIAAFAYLATEINRKLLREHAETVLGCLDLAVGVFVWIAVLQYRGDIHELSQAAGLIGGLGSLMTGGNPSDTISVTMLSPWIAALGAIEPTLRGGAFAFRKIAASWREGDANTQA